MKLCISRFRIALAFAALTLAFAPASFAQVKTAQATAPVPASSQPSAAAQPAAAGTASDKAASEKAKAPTIPDEFRSIKLGSSLDAVKGLLEADMLFGYRGERDVSLLPGENRSLIETVGGSFVKRAWFQFSEDKLYVMTLSLDPEKIDYYSVYSHLVGKYGEPTSLDPRKAVWGDEKVSLSLERPLTVKYTDVETFKKLLESDTTKKAASDIAREGFINEF
jgi:hypothetical protein